MFLPIGDEPNLRGTPFVTYTLLAVNAAVFLLISLPLMGQAPDPANPALREFLAYLSQQTGQSPWALQQSISAYDLFTFEHGFKPAAPALYDLLMSMFLHGGWMHVIGNMLFLWIYGDNVELAVGRVPFLVIYLATGAAASLFHMVFSMSSMTPMIGASGAISGVLGCYFLWFPHNKIRILVVFFFIQVILLPARWVLGFYLVVENLLPFMVAPTTGGGVAYGAHIGGFIGGLAVAALVRHKGPGEIFARARQQGTFRRARQESEQFVAPRQRFSDALAQGQYSEALAAYSDMSLLERSLVDEQELFTVVDYLADRDQHDLALSMLQRYIAGNPTPSSLARAHLRAGLVLGWGLGRQAAAKEHLLVALSLDPPPNVREAAREALARLG